MQHQQRPNTRPRDGRSSKHNHPRRYADAVVGGQAGSEGKGALAAHLVRTGGYAGAVRPGSSNAGHTVYGPGGDEYVHQVIPSAATVDPGVKCYMAPESSFGLGELFEEHQDTLDRWGGEQAAGRLVVDQKAAVITHEHRGAEADRRLGEDIGSTVHGCGAVRAEKIWRSAGDVRLAEQYDALARFLPTGGRRGHPEGTRVPGLLAGHGRRGENILIEGTQGTLLSMNQSPHWPFSTSRDCTASAFLSSCGLPPTAARDVWAVFRTHPIRVGGHSGPMDGDEISFEAIAERAGLDEPPVEYTSVTDKKRRVFEWSWSQLETALRLNDPDLLCLTFLDYLDAANRGARSWWDLTRDTQQWVREVHNRARGQNGARVAVLKTGPRPESTIDLRTPAPDGSERRWTMGWLPPDRAESPPPTDADAPAHGGPGDDWRDNHPEGGRNYGDESIDGAPRRAGERAASSGGAGNEG